MEAEQISTDLQQVEEREAKRYRLLKTIYDSAGDNTTDGIPYAEAFAKAALEEDEGHDILEYLIGKGMMSNRTGIGWLALSHEGIVEMEQSIMQPEIPTEHFNSAVVQRFYAAVGVVQTTDGNPGTAEKSRGLAIAQNADQKLVAERQQRRESMMRRIYAKSEGNISTHIYYHEVRNEEGLTEEEFNAVFDYLKANWLVDDRYSGGVFEITQTGIDYVEEQIKKPYRLTNDNSERTEQHFYGPVGAVQNAEGSTAYVIQTIANSSELASLLQELRTKLEALPDNQEALEQLSDLEEEAKSPNPKKSRIVATAKYIGSIVKDIGVSIASEAIVKSVGG